MWQLILILIVAVIAIYVVIDGNSDHTYHKECNCGRYDKCKSSITITPRGGMIRNDFYKCGKFKDALDDFDDFWANARINQDS